MPRQSCWWLRRVTGSLAIGETTQQDCTMPSAAQDALIHIMIVAASSDSTMTERELFRIGR